MTSSVVSGLARSRRAVDLVEQERPVLVGDAGVGIVDTGVGGADHRPSTHRDDVEQPAGVVEERQHPPVRGELVDDQMDALGVHDAVLGAQAERLVDAVEVRSGGVDQHLGVAAELASGLAVAQLRMPATAVSFGAGQFDVVRGDGTEVHRGADEAEHEPGVVVLEDGVGVLDAAAHVAGVDDRFEPFDALGAERSGRVGLERADPPVRERTDGRQPRRERRRPPHGREEPDLGDVRRIGPHQPIAALAELADQQELVVLEVLEPAPDEVRRFLAGLAGEIASIDQGHLRAAGGQRSRGDGAVDAAADDEHVEGPAVELVHVGRAQP